MTNSTQIDSIQRMAKKKKINEKLRAFYRGPVIRPHKIATDNELLIIHRFVSETYKQRKQLNIVYGLTQSLRCLKQKRIKCIVFDSSLATHISKYLIHFCHKQNVPIIQADNISVNLAKLIGFRTLLIFSLVEGNDQITCDVPEVVNNFLDLIHNVFDDSLKFKDYNLDKVASSGKSQAKKLLKKKTKRQVTQ